MPTSPPPSPPASPAPAPRTTYPEAVALYERGLEALQRREFDEAAATLRAVLARYPEERELHERVRLYLRVCERETQPPAPPPQTVEDRVYAATVALNAGAPDEALTHLRSAIGEAPDNDHVHYMLAVAHAQRGEAEPAVAHLRRAIQLNPENRGLARQEPDFEVLRHHDAFREATQAKPLRSLRRRIRARATR